MQIPSHQRSNLPEPEQSGQQVKEIGLLHGLQGSSVRSGPDGLTGEFLDRPVCDDRRGRERGPQHQTFKSTAPAQGDIGLPMGEGTAHIDNGTVKCQSLALVDGDGPGKLHRILAEYAVYFLTDFLCLLVKHISGIGPFFPAKDYGLPVIPAPDFYAVPGERLHHPEHPVVIAVLPR